MMNGKYQRYPKYRDSEIDWLGNIPSEWKVCPLKFMAKIKNGQDYKSVEVEDGYAGKQPPAQSNSRVQRIGYP